MTRDADIQCGHRVAKTHNSLVQTTPRAWQTPENHRSRGAKPALWLASRFCRHGLRRVLLADVGKNLFVYVSSYGPNAQFPDCQPPHDKISVVKIDVENPRNAAIVNEPVLFPDGGNQGTGYSSATSGL